jgi:hypothetical protein
MPLDNQSGLVRELREEGQGGAASSYIWTRMAAAETADEDIRRGRVAADNTAQAQRAHPRTVVGVPISSSKDSGVFLSRASRRRSLQDAQRHASEPDPVIIGSIGRPPAPFKLPDIDRKWPMNKNEG